MLFNVDRCKILRVDHGNSMVPYTMNGVGLQALQEEGDLGIVIQEDVKWPKQCPKTWEKSRVRKCSIRFDKNMF
jgi:hypothetical protein